MLLGDSESFLIEIFEYMYIDYILWVLCILGYKILEVIEGRVDAYVYIIRIKKWDICVGNVILFVFYGKMIILEGVFIDYFLRKEVVNNNGLLVILFDYYKYLE